MKEALLSILETPVVVIPPTPCLPLPVHVPRPQRPTVEVNVLDAAGAAVRSTQGVELSKDGVFLAANAFAPPLFSKLQIALRGGGGALGMECEVVRQVTPAQAAAWGMSEGVGVQFVRMTDPQRRALAALLRGDELPLDTPPVNEPIPDPELVLAPLRFRMASARPSTGCSTCRSTPTCRNPRQRARDAPRAEGLPVSPGRAGPAVRGGGPPGEGGARPPDADQPRGSGRSTTRSAATPRACRRQSPPASP